MIYKIVFFNSNSVLGRLVRLFTNSDLTHVSLALPNGKVWDITKFHYSRFYIESKYLTQFDKHIDRVVYVNIDTEDVTEVTQWLPCRKKLSIPAMAWDYLRRRTLSARSCVGYVSFALYKNGVNVRARTPRELYEQLVSAGYSASVYEQAEGNAH